MAKSLPYAFEMVTGTRACHVPLNFDFFLKSVRTSRIYVHTAITSCQWLLGAESLRLPNTCSDWEGRWEHSRGKYAGVGVFVWKWRDKHRAGVIEFLIKVYFMYCMKVTKSALVAWNCKSSFTSLIQWLKHMKSALMWKQSCYPAMLLSKIMLVLHNYCNF